MPVKLEQNKPFFHEAETPSPVGSEPGSAGSVGRPASPGTPELPPSYYESKGIQSSPTNKLFLRREPSLGTLLTPPQSRGTDDPSASRPAAPATPRARSASVGAPVEASLERDRPGASLDDILAYVPHPILALSGNRAAPAHASIEALLDAARPGAFLGQILTYVPFLGGSASASPRPVSPVAADEGMEALLASARPGASLEEILYVRPFPYTLSSTPPVDAAFEALLASARPGASLDEILYFQPFPYRLNASSSRVPSAGAAQQVALRPAIEAKHLASLDLMRFRDKALNIKLLEEFKYDLNKVVDVLIDMENRRAARGG